MSYTYISYVQFREPANNKFENPSVAPIVSAIDGSDGSAIAGASITNIDTGIYRCALTIDDKKDVIFKVTTTDPTFPDFALLESERHFNILDTLTDIPANFWGYVTRTLTQTATEISATISDGSISQVRGNTWAISVDLDMDLTAAKIQLAIKQNSDDADSESVVFIDTDAGLIYLDGDAAASASDGSIDIDDALNGLITVNLNASATSRLEEGLFRYGFQVVVGATVIEAAIGNFTIVSDIVHASS